MRLPAALLTLVYLAALAVALRDPAEHLLAVVVLLLGITARLLLRPSARGALAHAVRRTAPVADDVAAPAVVPATPA